MRDYQFKSEPLLMQKDAVNQIRENRCCANWCGPGAGKTNAALLISRELNLKVTVIICPNSVKDTWLERIDKVYPNNSIKINYNSINDIISFDRNVFNYIIINYDKFSCDNKNQGISLINKLLSLNMIDFIVIDEIHFAKSLSKIESNRRERIKYLRLEAEKKNPNLYVYGMTATPVINSIGEVRSLIELITGKEHSEIGDKISYENCFKAHYWLNIIGFRFIPDYGINVDEKIIKINADELAKDIANCKNDVQIESLLIDKKLSNEYIIKELTPGTIIYSHFKTNIVSKICKKLDNLGLSYGIYTGDISSEDRKDQIKKFKNKEFDIMVATDPISTGVDGLQEISNKITVLGYPQTGALWDQLIGRINRQGSIFDKVTIIHPQVFINTNNGEWNYDKRCWNRIKNKQTLSDIIVDGHIHSINLLNKNKLVKLSIESLKNGIKDINFTQNNIKVKNKFTEQEYKNSESFIKDVHKKANTSTSEHMHNWFTNNPNDWIKYHKQREISKLKWDEDPVDIIANKINERNDTNVIADMGCGLAKLSKIVKEPNKVISIDHYSEDPNIIQCDMKHTPLNDNETDITVFCLSLWGTNYLDYIKEAYRITAKRGFMYIVEPINSKKFDFDKLKEDIKMLGFDKTDETIRGKFIYLKFTKN